MSISGSLEDVSVAEVMQFIHLGGRTGTLQIESGGRQAEVGFHDGKIISAGTPGSRRLGAVLLERGLIDEATLEDALWRQKVSEPRVSLGKLLVDDGSIGEEDLRAAVGEEIERTIYELVGWTEGGFRFSLEERRPVDDIAVYPADILPEINLDTQMVVLDALRIFDERNRERLLAKKAAADRDRRQEAERMGDATERQSRLAQLFDAEAAARHGGEVLKIDAETEAALRPAAPRLQVVSEDYELVSALGEAVAPELAEVTPATPAEAGAAPAGEPAPVVLVDLRSPGLGVADLAALGRRHPRATLLAVVDPAVSAWDAYEAGALAVLPPRAEAITACLESALRHREAIGAAAGSEGPAAAGFERLREVVAELRSGLLSASVALSLMKVISDSVERAILFLVRGRRLVAQGAFGFGAGNRSLAAVTRGLEIDLDQAGVLAATVDDGRARSLAFEEARLPATLAAILGRPRSGQTVLFPVQGSERVIFLVYTDNGPSSHEIEEIEILELAAAQVGIAFENEIRRREIAADGESG